MLFTAPITACNYSFDNVHYDRKEFVALSTPYPTFQPFYWPTHNMLLWRDDKHEHFPSDCTPFMKWNLDPGGIVAFHCFPKQTSSWSWQWSLHHFPHYYMNTARHTNWCRPIFRANISYCVYPIDSCTKGQHEQLHPVRGLVNRRQAVWWFVLQYVVWCDIYMSMQILVLFCSYCPIKSFHRRYQCPIILIMTTL